MGALEALGIYVHWPFCLSKCPYCDFNSHVAVAVDEARWRDALVRDLDYFAAESVGRVVESIYFGGGTPSLMSPQTVGTVIEAVGVRWPVADTVEISLEANPGAAETGRFRDFREAGVNRLSIGVQSLSDKALRLLGRRHSAVEARTAVERAHRCFPRVSFDLMYGLPGQTVAHWSDMLGDALAMAGDHMSVYQLTIEPGTAFCHQGIESPEEELSIDFFEATADILARAGLPAYEISNHARPGGVCRHNVAVWRGGDYLGIGPGAHGRLSSGGLCYALRQICSPEKWLHAVERRGTGVADRQALSASERGQELLLLGLRLTNGIEWARFAALAGVPMAEVINNHALAVLTEQGDVIADNIGLRATPQGQLRLNSVLAMLLT
ncbi:MAG: coproporphyrinogen III oxidase [Hyphomicrobiales bacterium]|nr:coproporphyrinogen III oxidase [Hyphomicrobiales bacterium]